MGTTAAAPSDRGELLAAVTVPFALNTGLSAASFSRVVSGLGNSSTANVRLVRTAWPSFALPVGRGDAPS